MTDSAIVVDDSGFTRRVALKCMKEHLPQMELLEAVSAEDAIEKLKEHSGRLVLALLDYNMPGMNGIELARKLRESHPETLLALCTANIQEALMQQAKELNIAFLKKPYTKDKFKQVIEELGVVCAHH